MPSKVTITAKTGPGLTVTSQVINNVTDVNLDLVRKEADIITVDGIIHEFDINGVTTLTDTISSGNHTIVIS